MKLHYSPLEFRERPLYPLSFFFVVMCICLTNHVLFCSTGRYFVKNAYISNFFSKWWNCNVYLLDKSRSPGNGYFGYKYLFRMKDHYSPLECIPSFFVVMCICLTNHVLFCSTGRYFVKNAYISNFFSKWWNSGI